MKKKEIKIWHISDTHGYHNLLDIPTNIDIIIHSGDASNSRSALRNSVEINSFLYWYKKIPVKYKIYVAGNHDLSIEKKNITKKNIEANGIIYLENESIDIKGFKIYGSPHVPNFGNWSFMKSRQKLDKVWQAIPEDTDILVTHGPPKNILDATDSYDNNIERVGDSALFKRIMKLNLKAHLFGHIHNSRTQLNSGIMTLSNKNTIFSNGSVVTDGKFGELSSNGNIITLKI